MAAHGDPQRAKRLAQDLVRDIVTANKAELERHNSIGDTAYVFKELFDRARNMYLTNVGAGAGAVKTYFDEELQRQIFSKMNRPSYKN